MLTSSETEKNIIDKTHGAGGAETAELIETVFKEAFSNEYLDRLSDAAVIPGTGNIALTTDTFVVRPVFFPGGDIGRLAVCGTVNDILMSGALPRYLTAGFVLEEGLETDALKRVVRSMADTAKEAGVEIVTGDTKVVEAADPKEPGLIINTSGVGFLRDGSRISYEKIRENDAVILSGNLGDHHAAILSTRMSVKNHIVSDAAPLTEMVRRLMDSGVDIHAMRDVTRGGLATILNEFSSSAGLHIRITEGNIPVAKDVADFCRLLGLDPMYMGNEGKCIFFIAKEDAERALDIIRKSKYGSNAAVIGRVDSNARGVTMLTAIGGEKIVAPLFGEGLPRIC